MGGTGAGILHRGSPVCCGGRRKPSSQDSETTTLGPATLLFVLLPHGRGSQSSALSHPIVRLVILVLAITPALVVTPILPLVITRCLRYSSARDHAMLGLVSYARLPYTASNMEDIGEMMNEQGIYRDPFLILPIVLSSSSDGFDFWSTAKYAILLHGSKNLFCSYGEPEGLFVSLSVRLGPRCGLLHDGWLCRKGHTQYLPYHEAKIPRHSSYEQHY